MSKREREWVKEELQWAIEKSRSIVKDIKRAIAEARMVYSRIRQIIGVLERPSVTSVVSMVLWLASELQKLHEQFLRAEYERRLLRLEMKRRERLLAQALNEVEIQRREAFRSLVPG